MSPQATVRAQARSALKHNYARAVIAFVTALLPVFLIDSALSAAVLTIDELIKDPDLSVILQISVYYPLMIIGGIFLSPILNGYIRVFYRNGFTGEMEIGDLFYYFEKGRYRRTLLLNVGWLLRLLIPAILAYLPVTAYVVICSKMKNDFSDSVLYRDVYFIITILSTVILVLYSLRYFTVFTLHVENEELSPRELFRTSKIIMRSQSVSAAKLIFSYTPWMLLCLTVLPMLYVVPYMTQGLCIGAKWMTRAAYEE